MLLFRSEEHIDTWYRRRGIATGATLTLDQQWELARIWYATADARRSRSCVREPRADRRVLALDKSVGLTRRRRDRRAQLPRSRRSRCIAQAARAPASRQTRLVCGSFVAKALAGQRSASGGSDRRQDERRQGGDQSPNQRARLVAPNSSFSAANSREGSCRSAAACGPLRKSTSTLLTSPSPNSA
jgi:hypothetical protein